MKMDPIIGAWAAASAAAKVAAALANIPVPDEFFDPVMEFIMEDPVSAPTSRISWTGKRIVSIIEEDGVCPFTKSSLAVKDLKPKTDLRAEIRQF